MDGTGRLSNLLRIFFNNVSSAYIWSNRRPSLAVTTSQNLKKVAQMVPLLFGMSAHQKRDAMRWCSWSSKFYYSPFSTRQIRCFWMSKGKAK